MSKPTLHIEVVITARVEGDALELLTQLQQLAQTQVLPRTHSRNRTPEKPRRLPEPLVKLVAEEQLETEARQHVAAQVDAKDEVIRNGQKLPVPADLKTLEEKKESFRTIAAKESVKTVVAEIIKCGIGGVLGGGKG